MLTVPVHLAVRSAARTAGSGPLGWRIDPRRRRARFRRAFDAAAHEPGAEAAAEAAEGARDARVPGARHVPAARGPPDRLRHTARAGALHSEHRGALLMASYELRVTVHREGWESEGPLLFDHCVQYSIQ